MSKQIKQLTKDAKQAFGEKQFQIAEEKCHVSVEAFSKVVAKFGVKLVSDHLLCI